MPDSFRALADISTVVSILPIPVDEKKPGLVPGSFIIRPVKDPKRDVEILHVGRSMFPVYIDENRPALIVPEPSNNVCASIVRDFKTPLPGYEAGKAEPGIFWVPGVYEKKDIERELKDELLIARNLQHAWFLNLVAIADDDWAKVRMRRIISGLQRVACRCLGLEREWNLDREVELAANVDMIQCKFCRSSVHSDAIICPQCTGILDMDRARKEYRTVADLQHAGAAPAQ